VSADSGWSLVKWGSVLTSIESELVGEWASWSSEQELLVPGGETELPLIERLVLVFTFSLADFLAEEAEPD